MTANKTYEDDKSDECTCHMTPPRADENEETEIVNPDCPIHGNAANESGESNQSEVARLRSLIDLEYESARQALNGPTLGTAQHKFLTKRLENIAGHVEALREVASPEEVMQVFTQLEGMDMRVCQP